MGHLEHIIVPPNNHNEFFHLHTRIHNSDTLFVRLHVMEPRFHGEREKAIFFYTINIFFIRKQHIFVAVWAHIIFLHGAPRVV